MFKLTSSTQLADIGFASNGDSVTVQGAIDVLADVSSTATMYIMWHALSHFPKGQPTQMGEQDLESVVAIGKILLTTKWFSVAMYCMWIYDYFLTFGDEVMYAWSGRKSWVFGLFIASRYIPVLHIIYKGLILFGFTKPLCQRTKWEVNLYTVLVAFLAQTTVAFRLYAVTGRGKLQGGILSFLILAQLVGGIWFIVVTGIHPMQQLPNIDLDAYKVCFFQQWRPGQFTFITIAISFDIFALLTIFFASRGPWLRYPGIPTLLRTILRDATIYFLLMFACQLVLLFFLFLAPVQAQLLPGITHSMFLPMMTCRLMLSLKKAAWEPTGLWSLSNPDGERRSGGTIQFLPPTLDTSHETSDTIVQPAGEDIELGVASGLPQKSGSP